MARETRDSETREENQRKGWKPPSLLPVPLPQPGIAFRYIRTSTMGDADIKNVSSRMREGWVPVKAEDHPELEVLRDPESRFKDGIEIGGLLLCQTASENVSQRKKYYEDRTQQQMESVDQDYLRANDPRMPLSRPERRTRTTFGSGK